MQQFVIDDPTICITNEGFFQYLENQAEETQQAIIQVNQHLNQTNVESTQ